MTKRTNEQIEHILETLNEWKGEKISIEKAERDDIDKNTLSLAEVEVVHQPEDVDDYVDPFSIELRGKGTVVNNTGTKRLPLDSYELPIKELVSFEASKEFMTIKTDRATYIIRK